MYIWVPILWLEKPLATVFVPMALSGLTVSPVHSHEIAAVMQLHATLLEVRYPPSFFLHLLHQPSRRCLVARNDDEPVAFISAALHPGNRIEILTLGVLPSFRQRRLATRLVQDIVESLAGAKAAAATVFAQVSASNVSASAFYQQIGLSPGVVVRDIYRTIQVPGGDAYIVSGQIQSREESEKVMPSKLHL
ncbi:acyl-CoA N-acyltransferase [Mycena alexandri]|uniref:Acyl-CoA N-acyltransferase n=1 Tax=Mycena alexandri TaxID=1745969 RepID=A0AAD6X8D3_9AGAR|nr:acyl-CoA N-acyltransferase [Mycena alexandri]